MQVSLNECGLLSLRAGACRGHQNIRKIFLHDHWLIAGAVLPPDLARPMGCLTQDIFVSADVGVEQLPTFPVDGSADVS